MTRSRSLSTPARRVLAVLAQAAGEWSHGYDLCREAGVLSGTLYPLLTRLAEQGHLDAEWRKPAAPGRPARHVYRLTAAGRQLAAENPVTGAAAARRERFA